jgi:hypothetical protein
LIVYIRYKSEAIDLAMRYALQDATLQQVFRVACECIKVDNCPGNNCQRRAQILIEIGKRRQPGHLGLALILFAKALDLLDDVPKALLVKPSKPFKDVIA